MQLALLTLGWPLAVLLLAYVAAWGVLQGTGLGTAAALAVWHGVLPLTLALAAGWLLRRATGGHLMAYLLGRGMVVPMAAGFAAAMAAQHALGRFDALGSHAGAALMLTALMDAMFTGLVLLMLVLYRPRWLATWAPRLYLRRGAVPQA